MEPPAWMAPLTGVIAFGTCVAMVSLYAYGGSLPPEHVAEVRAELAVPADAAWALLTDLERRPEWRPHVVRIERNREVPSLEVWREQDTAEDHFDLLVVENARPKLVFRTARPEDVGMDAVWTWTVEERGAGSLVTVTEVGRVRNELVRGWWGLRAGPYAGIAPDLAGFAAALGDADARIERR